MALSPATNENQTRKRAERLGPQVRRPMILDAAYEAMLERGFDGTSMAEVAERAGVTKPVVYDSFENKDDLFAALRTRERERIIGEIAAVLPPDPMADPENSIALSLAAFFEYVNDNPLAFKLIVLGEGASGEAFEQIDERRSEYVASIAELIAGLAGDSGEPPTMVRVIARALVGAAEGVARGFVAEPGRFDPERTGRLVARIAVSGTNSLF